MDAADWQALQDALALGDPDRYVAAFFAPAAKRKALIALYAFDHEVGRIGALAREPMAGHIRFAWWREQVDAIFKGAVVQAPVARALADVVRGHGDLPRDEFDRYLDARALDLEEVPFETEAALEAYASNVGGGIVRLASRFLGAGHRADAAAGFAGRACVHAGHLRDWVPLAARRRCRVPVAWLDEAKLRAEDLFDEAGASPAMRQVAERLAVLMRGSLRQLNAERFAREATPALAPATLVRWVGGDPWQVRPMPSWQRVGRLALSNLTRRF